MSFPRDTDDIERLSDKQADAYLAELLAGLRSWTLVRDAKDSLAALVTALDEADAQDIFGTEGWRHALLGED